MPTSMREDVVNLSIKGVPVDLAERLRARAARNRRSLQGELMAIIEAAAHAADVKPPLAPAGLARSRATRSINEVVDSLRARFPDPSADAPLGVDIIRAARDGR